jgi:hypothetical protein
MTSQTIAATIRGIEFRIRADWSDPAAPVQIEAEEGYAWHDTGDTVGDWSEDTPAIDAPHLPSPAAAAAIAGIVQVFFCHPRWPALSAGAIVAAAPVED